MDNLEPKSSDLSAGRVDLSNSDDLRDQLDSVRHLVVSVLILVIVVSGTLNIFFLRQLRDAHRQLAQIRPQAAQMMANYQKTEAPMMQTIVNRFTEYGRIHPDYAPILSKYNIKYSGPGGAASPPPPAITPDKK